MIFRQRRFGLFNFSAICGMIVLVWDGMIVLLRGDDCVGYDDDCMGWDDCVGYDDRLYDDDRGNHDHVQTKREENQKKDLYEDDNPLKLF